MWCERIRVLVGSYIHDLHMVKVTDLGVVFSLLDIFGVFPRREPPVHRMDWTIVGRQQYFLKKMAMVSTNRQPAMPAKSHPSDWVLNSGVRVLNGRPYDSSREARAAMV